VRSKFEVVSRTAKDKLKSFGGRGEARDEMCHGSRLDAPYDEHVIGGFKCRSF
jgi:hypothetical protein